MPMQQAMTQCTRRRKATEVAPGKRQRPEGESRNPSHSQGCDSDFRFHFSSFKGCVVFCCFQPRLGLKTTKGNTFKLLARERLTLPGV